MLGLNAQKMRDINMSIAKDIESLVVDLSPKQIKAILKGIKKPSIRKIDTSYSKRSNAVTQLYFSAEPTPHMVDGTFDMYSQEREAIWQQIKSGVDI